MIKKLNLRLLPLSAAIIIALTASIAHAAWTGPTATAPNSNTAAPVNVGGASQVKSGGFWAASVGSDSGYCIGASCITTWSSLSSQWTTNGTSVYYNGGNVGIGTNAPTHQLQVVGTANNEFSIYDYGGGHGLNIRMYAANGTVSSPAAVIPGIILGGFAARGYNGSRFARGARIIATPSENWTPTANGGILRFETAPSSPNPPDCPEAPITVDGCSIERMRIDQNGNVGIGTASPSAKLNVIPGNLNNAGTLDMSGAGLLVGTTVGGIGIDGNQIENTGSPLFLNFNSANNIILVNGGGSVGIGAVNPLDKLQVNGDIRIGTSGSNGCLKNAGGGVIVGTCSSDERLKEVTGNVGNVLGGISNLNLIKFRWNDAASALYHNDKSLTNTGFIAQDVQKQFPELVTTDENGYYQLDYSTLNLYAIEAIKELSQKVNAQQKEIDELKAVIETLKK